jgi:hypothetical protein
MRYPADPADLRKGSPEWRRFMVQEVGLPEAWLDFAASGANLPFLLADRQGRFDDMMQMLGGGQDADKKKNQMRDYLLFDMRMTRVWWGPWAIEQHKPFVETYGGRFTSLVLQADACAPDGHAEVMQGFAGHTDHTAKRCVASANGRSTQAEA